MLDSVLFYLFASVAVLSAALMITRRNPIHSAVYLMTTLLATGGIFLQLRATFLFFTQIILYAGGVMTLFLLVIKVVRSDAALHPARLRFQELVAFWVAVALGLEFIVVLLLARKLPGEGLFISSRAFADQLPANSEALATSLSSDYLLSVELASVLLLIAIVGAVLLLKRKKAEET
jgi:NADH-quinone oxidoreductase subunit J